MKKVIRFSLVSTLLLSSFLAGCGKEKTTTKPKEEKKVLQLTETGEIPSLNSLKVTDAVSFNVLNNVMEGLFRLSKNDEVIPGIAQKHEISKDGKTYTFHLRDAKWSNGDPVTAHDFVYAWKQLVNPETGSEYAYIMYDVKNAEKINKKQIGLDELGVKAQDDKTFTVELEHPVPYFTKLLCLPSFYPINEKYAKEQGDKYGLEANKTLYNGPFTLSEWKHEASFTMKKNNQYWDKKEVKLDEVNYQIVKEISTVVNLYQTDKVDRAVISTEFVDKYKNDKELKQYTDPVMYFFRFNENVPILKNKNARLALSMAFDKKGLATSFLNDGSVPANYYVPNGFLKGPDKKDFRETTTEFNKTNVNKAKEYWEKAKQETGTNEVTLEMLNYDLENFKKVGEYIKEQLEKNLPELTIKVKLQPHSQKLALEKKKEYEMSLSRWLPDYPDPMTYLEVFISESGVNNTGYANAEYDALIKKTKMELGNDEKARWKAMQDAEKMLLDDAVIAPVFQRGLSYLQKPYVKDLYVHQFGPATSLKWTDVKK
ncbi:peptide ABC transporter substrate-binding protein [Bacillus pseudomycoides]|uniref:peptide ABC transporter substrate-binding protein n=1 Tax=Bacillus pseudomycoides TaxID=64104 RepID=UPI000BEE63CB|nr:peptide ABC transporter substrate-binding protein [Bacillus pseudomycoides]PDY46978.1 peptide ABC transporter substrate-binding protein [Bacillus pseudomycoides]PED71740.1 peptide ABC transporter substrate-binding protein [Bacillus pseudomycoides]PEI36248.1 peptide ABC transporter substrate-binding protein [Bacillus pseudomycoides]PEJ81689.1 peptide ABC transporter substrate-binding protein [Bacillus pseudomycoides]PEM08840.1 peptide ABC transporter substrate-binding protein [Bacillus pseud